MLMEMKNAHFKRGCKRSNNHDPVKATARFWVDQSAYSLKKGANHNVSVIPPDPLSSLGDSSLTILLSDGVDVTPLWCLCDANDVELTSNPNKW